MNSGPASAWKGFKDARIRFAAMDAAKDARVARIKRTMPEKGLKVVFILNLRFHHLPARPLTLW
jgi:hypothetical protein